MEPVMREEVTTKPLFPLAFCRGILLVLALTFGVSISPLAAFEGDESGNWLQWAHDARHTGLAEASGQSPDRNLFNIVYDPLVPQEQTAAGGDLEVHYQTPLVDEDDHVFMEFKSGTFDPNTAQFATQIWGEKKLSFENGKMQVKWSYDTDWKAPGSLNDFWEPVFHPAVVGSYIYLPGAGGSIWKLSKGDGVVIGRINPFGGKVDPKIFTASPLTADSHGDIYYNAIKLKAANIGFFDEDIVQSWLVKVSSNGAATKVSYKALVPDAPTKCLGDFSDSPLPWPPTPDAVPPFVPCGKLRAAVNAAPAIGPDGTIYTGATMHFDNYYSWIVAANADLSPRWAASLRDRFQDGCGVPVSMGGVLPPNGTPGGCRAGAHLGVDPATNRPGAGQADDDSSASITVAPDGVLYGVYNRYNYSQGHLIKFDFQGAYVGAFGFGWDSTPAIYRHGGSYSIVIKNNHYSGGSYCDDDKYCPPDRTSTNPSSPEQYFLSQLSPSLALEWSFQNTNKESCRRNPAGGVTCVSDHPAGFEWCVNAPAIDQAGVVYANSEDGNLYAVYQGGRLKRRIFQQLALGAAYTPMSIGPDGKLYSQNAGHLFVVGK
jgi:hypothetical protein